MGAVEIMVLMTQYTREKNPVCLMCGLCCHHWEKGKLKACKYLVKLKNKKTLCRGFKQRLGRKIRSINGYPVVCIERKNAVFDFPNCPFNTGKPDFMKHGENKK